VTEDEILRKLYELQEKEDVMVLHAVESGSRAWGFASPDSDYDVRFIYIRKTSDYLRLEKTRDVIEWELNDVYDINGWDAQKMLRLLYKSNPTVFEWFHSPIVYMSEKSAVEKILPEIDSFFSCKAGIYHYLSTAKVNHRAYFKGEEVKLKKYFYVIRPLLACRWIIEKGTPPPMLFSELLNTVAEREIVPVIEELVRIKVETPEKAYGNRIPELDRYIEKNREYVKKYLDGMPDDRNYSWKKLNDIFMYLVNYRQGNLK